MKTCTIGFFDSGIGGISVMTHARKILPSADFLYYADTDHVPYGIKTQNEIIEYSDQAVRTLLSYGADLIVIACNTATSMAAETLRRRYDLPIIGMEPAVKPAAEGHPGEKILVCATPATIAGEKLHHLIDQIYDPSTQPTLKSLPGLVTFAEQAIFDPDIVCSYLAKNIERKEQYAAVVLGCTHFPYFKDSFRAFFGPETDLIDGTIGTVKHLKVLAEEKGYQSTEYHGKVTYFRSGRLLTKEADLRYFHLLEERGQQCVTL